jgi:hypothetical protein
MTTITKPQEAGDRLPSPFVGALFGAIAIGIATALVIGVLGATGGIRSGTTVAGQPATAETAMPGMTTPVPRPGPSK